MQFSLKTIAEMDYKMVFDIEMIFLSKHLSAMI